MFRELWREIYALYVVRCVVGSHRGAVGREMYALYVVRCVVGSHRGAVGREMYALYVVRCVVRSDLKDGGGGGGERNIRALCCEMCGGVS